MFEWKRFDEIYVNECMDVWMHVPLDALSNDYQ